jgi:hypothetical protein
MIGLRSSTKKNGIDVYYDASSAGQELRAVAHVLNAQPPESHHNGSFFVMEVFFICAI